MWVCACVDVERDEPMSLNRDLLSIYSLFCQNTMQACSALEQFACFHSL